ncbi:MAG: exo-alpha-sialidase [Promethearchaeota archaeon]
MGEKVEVADGIEVETLTKPVWGVLERAHCSSVAALPDGELLVVYYHGLREAHRKQGIWGVRKPPGGRWSEPFLVSKGVSWARMEGNPVLWVAPDTGLLWLFHVTSWGGWSTCVLRYKTSEDGGRTWSGSGKVYPHVSRLSKNPPVLTSRGWYLLPATIEFRECTPMFLASLDQGRTWRDVGARLVVPEAARPPGSNKWGRMLDQPTVFERDDGSLACLMRAYKPLGKAWESTSNDGGLTWSEPRPGNLPNPDGAFHAIKLKSGKVAVAYNHSSKERNPLSVATSDDGGRTWSHRRNVCEYRGGDGAFGFEYPTVTQGPDGALHVTWTLAQTTAAVDGTTKSWSDVQYARLTEQWVEEREFFDEAWET